jgi:signal transduction histidine kinase
VLECRFVVDSRIPPTVVVDPDATAEAVSNLLDNARRYATGLIAVRLSTEKSWLVIEVTDDGPGLPAGSEAQAFQRFVTLDGQGGTGLGLAIARELTERQGGDLTYAGKAFVLRLPFHEGPARPPSGGPGSGTVRRADDALSSAHFSSQPIPTAGPRRPAATGHRDAAAE